MEINGGNFLWFPNPWPWLQQIKSIIDRLQGCRYEAFMKILCLGGPNLIMLGLRRPGIYGASSLEDIHQSLQDQAAADGMSVDCRQSNHEGELVTPGSSRPEEISMPSSSMQGPTPIQVSPCVMQFQPLSCPRLKCIFRIFMLAKPVGTLP